MHVGEKMRVFHSTGMTGRLRPGCFILLMLGKQNVEIEWTSLQAANCKMRHFMIN